MLHIRISTGQMRKWTLLSSEARHFPKKFQNSENMCPKHRRQHGIRGRE
jgi:hypothetical protein